MKKNGDVDQYIGCGPIYFRRFGCNVGVIFFLDDALKKIIIFTLPLHKCQSLRYVFVNF